MSRFISLIAVLVAFGSFFVSTPAAQAEPAARWAGQKIAWLGSAHGTRDNLRYDCGSDHSVNYLLPKNTVRNLCASTPNPVTVYIWVPPSCHFDYKTRPPTSLFWHNSGETPGAWFVYTVTEYPIADHRYGVC